MILVENIAHKEQCGLEQSVKTAERAAKLPLEEALNEAEHSLQSAKDEISNKNKVSKRSIGQQRLTQYDERAHTLSEVSLNGGGVGWVYDSDGDSEKIEYQEEAQEIDSLGDGDDRESLVGEDEIRVLQQQEAATDRRVAFQKEKEYLERDKQLRLKENNYWERQAKLLEKQKKVRQPRDGNVVSIDVTKVRPYVSLIYSMQYIILSFFIFTEG